MNEARPLPWFRFMGELVLVAAVPDWLAQLAQARVKKARMRYVIVVSFSMRPVLATDVPSSFSREKRMDRPELGAKTGTR